MEVKTNDLVITQAARWYARLHAFDCSDNERAAFNRWLEFSADNELAYTRTLRTAALLSCSLTNDPRWTALRTAALETPKRLTLKRPTKLLLQSKWQVAAATVLCVSLGFLAALQITKSRNAAGELESYANVTNRQQRIALEDGTVVHLDVGSRFTSRLSTAERRIELLAGRAYFDVKHDSTRPFFVTAGDIRTVDLGTRFQVALASKNVSVVLEEGSVAISDSREAADRASNRPVTSWNVTLMPGEQFKFSSQSGGRETQVVDAAALTSWSRGRLVFNGTPLAEALDEVNRYAQTKVRLGDQKLASVPIGGNFIAGGDSERVVEALAAVLPLRVVRVGANEIVLFQRYETETS